LFGLFC
jgi:hypothetical protein